MPGPVGCVRPAPDLLEANQGLWTVFRMCIDGDGTSFAGMDGIPIGIDPVAARQFADALAVPWNEETLVKLKMLTGFWKNDTFEKLERRRAADKAEAERKAAMPRMPR